MAYKLINCGDYRQRRSFSRIKKTYELKDLSAVGKVEILKKNKGFFVIKCIFD